MTYLTAGETVRVEVPDPLPATFKHFIGGWKNFANDVNGRKVTLLFHLRHSQMDGWKIRTNLHVDHKSVLVWLPTMWLECGRQGRLFQ